MGNNGDVVLYRPQNGGVWTDSKFYYAPGKLRSVHSVSNTHNGMKICVNGKTSNNRCTEVYKTNVCGLNACGLTSTKDYVTAPGDSGAPWFWGSNAYGIHQGRVTIDGSARSVFTPATVAQNVLGAHIKTS